MHRQAAAGSCETAISSRRRRTRVRTTDMRTTVWLGVIFSTSALAACGGGGGDTVDSPIVDQPDSPPGTPDARPDADPLAPDAAPEFACLGQPIPGAAATTLTVAGDMQVLSIGGSNPVSGATVTAYVVGNPTAI